MCSCLKTIILDSFLVLLIAKFLFGVGFAVAFIIHQRAHYNLSIDVSTGKTVQRYADHSQRVNSVAFNDDGTIVASASYDASIKLWDCRSLSKRPIQTLNEAKDSVEHVEIQGFEIIAG